MEDERGTRGMKRRKGGKVRDGWREKKKKRRLLELDCSVSCPILPHTHTHAHHAALLPTLNNASHRRDGAAAVATRERCGRAETAGRRAARGLAGNRLCTDVIHPSLRSPVSIHSSPHIPRPHAVIHQYSEIEREREDILYMSCAHVSVGKYVWSSFFPPFISLIPQSVSFIDFHPRRLLSSMLSVSFLFFNLQAQCYRYKSHSPPKKTVEHTEQ